MDYGGDYGGGDYGGGFVSHGGGGFSSSPQHGGGGESPGKGGAKASATVQTLTPVTVAQLSHAVQAHSEDTFRIDGKELHQITFVGQVLSSTPSSTNVTFQISDGSGAVDVRIWLDSEDEGAQNNAQWRPGMYVRVIGQLRSFQDRRSVVAYRLLPIENFNELTYHLLEAIYVHLYNLKGPLESAAGAGAQFGGVGVGGVGGGANPYQMSHTSTTSETNDVVRAILDVIKKCPMSEGANMAYLEQSLRHISPGELRRQVDLLSTEGLLYSTIDEDHFKAAD